MMSLPESGDHGDREDGGEPAVRDPAGGDHGDREDGGEPAVRDPAGTAPASKAATLLATSQPVEGQPQPQEAQGDLATSDAAPRATAEPDASQTAPSTSTASQQPDASGAPTTGVSPAEGAARVGAADEGCRAVQPATTSTLAGSGGADAVVESTPMDAAPPSSHGLPHATSAFVTEPEQLIIRSVYLVLTTLCALTVTDLGLVVALAGAASATTVIFIAPGACYYSLHPPGTRLRRSAALLCAIGCLLVPLLLLVVLAKNGALGPEWALDASVVKEGEEAAFGEDDD